VQHREYQGDYFSRGTRQGEGILINVSEKRKALAERKGLITGKTFGGLDQIQMPLGGENAADFGKEGSNDRVRKSHEGEVSLQKGNRIFPAGKRKRHYHRLPVNASSMPKEAIRVGKSTRNSGGDGKERIFCCYGTERKRT